MSTLGVRNRGAGSALKPKLAAEDFAPTQRPPLEASILPLSCYSSPEFFELEMERIFMKEWLCVGRTDQVAKPGDYVASTCWVSRWSWCAMKAKPSGCCPGSVDIGA